MARFPYPDFLFRAGSGAVFGSVLAVFLGGMVSGPVFGVRPSGLSDALAATVRGKVVIDSDKVHLSDLFDDLYPGQDRVLGPAPPPGGSIRVGGGQLVAIADEYGVDWVEQSSAAMVTIIRAGRLLNKEYFAETLRRELHIDGIRSSIDFVDFHPVIVPQDEKDPVSLSDIHWDKHTGRVSATVLRTHPLGDDTRDSFALNGIVRVAEPVFVFSRPMKAGDILNRGDVILNADYHGPMRNGMILSDDHIYGATLQKLVQAGDVLYEQDFRPTVMLRKGAPVMIIFDSPGIHLTVAGKALEDGMLDQPVHVLNVTSGANILGRVTGASLVRVESGFANTEQAGSGGGSTFSGGARP